MTRKYDSGPPCKVCGASAPDARLRAALDRAWLASHDARGMARPADLGDHLIREYAALARLDQS
jgi:hypothetical protein